MAIIEVTGALGVQVDQQAAPHLAYPLQITAKGAVTVPQDSPQDQVACVQAICDCPQGYRPEYPDFGIPDVLFSTVPVDTGQLGAAILVTESRGSLTITDTPILGNPSQRLIRIQVEAVNP